MSATDFTNAQPPLTAFERAMAGLAMLAPLLGILAVGALLGGCKKCHPQDNVVIQSESTSSAAFPSVDKWWK